MLREDDKNYMNIVLQSCKFGFLLHAQRLTV